MAMQVTCPPCGEVISAETDEDLVAKGQEHARVEHGHELTAEQILDEAQDVA